MLGRLPAVSAGVRCVGLGVGARVITLGNRVFFFLGLGLARCAGGKRGRERGGGKWCR